MSTGHHECGNCHRKTSIVSTPDQEIVALIQLYNKKYKGAPLCQFCLDKAETRLAAVKRNRNQENESPNTSSGSRERSETSITRAAAEPTSTDSRTERGDSLQAQMGTQTTKTLSQSLNSERDINSDEVPPFLPENAEELVSTVTQALDREDADVSLHTSSTETPANLEVYTPEMRPNEDNRKRSPERDERPSSKRTRVAFAEEVETIEETEEDAPPEEVVQQAPSSSETSDSDDDVLEVIENVSIAAPTPRHPRLRDEELLDLRERREDLESRGAAIVNNMPRTHAG